MKFTKYTALSKTLSLCVLSLYLVACSSNPEKTDTVEKKSAAQGKSVEMADAATSTQKPAAVSSVLPAGSVIPNPYLMTKPKLDEKTEVNFQDAIAAIQQKNWARAESVLQKLAEANPSLSGVQLNLGIVHLAKGDVAKAEAAFNNAIRVNSKNVDAYNQLAVLKRDQGKFTEAEVLYQKALAAWSFYPAGHKNIAILYEMYMGKPELALPHFQAYQQLLSAPDKQVDSWVADLDRRLNGTRAPVKAVEENTGVVQTQTESAPQEKSEAK